jgi:CRP-like cAMP-binding protein
MKVKELTVLEILRELELFNELKEPQLRKLTHIAEEVQFETDEIIYHEGELGKGIFIIQQGEVIIEMMLPEHGPVVLYTLLPGQLFGWSSLLAGRRKKARARAASPIRAIFIDANKVRDLFRQDHDLECRLMNCIISVMADRLYLTRDSLAHKSAR